MRLITAVTVLAGLALAACESTPPRTGPVQEGMTRAEVIDRLGQPCRTAARGSGSVEREELGFYCVQESPRLTVWMENGEVVRWQSYD